MGWARGVKNEQKEVESVRRGLNIVVSREHVYLESTSLAKKATILEACWEVGMFSVGR
jgi:hypothetical protein